MTKTDVSKGTKERILAEASNLFAKNGFAGTSVRDIATNADVNLAAINYHFKNKESLYWRVFEFNYDLIKKEVIKHGQLAKTTADLTAAVFHFFISSESAIMNTFKIFLSDEAALPEEDSEHGEKKHFGPPGEEVFLQKIKKDLGEEVSDAGAQWAVKMIFSILVHMGVVMNTSMMKEKCKKEANLTPEALEMAIRHSVAAHLNYLKENPQLF